MLTVPLRLPVAFLLFLLLTSLGAPLPADEGGEWVEVASLQRARQETGAARIGDRVYVVGGLVGFGFALDTVEVYDVTADRWSFVAPLPVGLDHMGVAALGGKLYVSGGYNGDFNARDELWIYDPATDSWSRGADLPEPRGAHWAVAHQGRLYVFGGVDAADVVQRSTFIYDPASDSWSRGADMLAPREHLNAVSVGEHIYVIGGRAGAASNRNERYDPAQDRWDTLAPLPTARSATAMAALDGRVHVMGGEIPRLFAVHEVYDIATDTWTCAAPMPVPRHGVAAVTLDDGILVPAGGTVQGVAPSAVADVFLPEGITAGPAGDLRFRFPTFRAAETDGTARITVTRVGGSAGAVSVDYGVTLVTTEAGATPGEDFLPRAGTLEWGDGDTSRRSFLIPILDDSEVEGDETVELTLSNPTGGAGLGTPATATLILEDDDSEGPGRVGFATDVVTVIEGPGSANVPLERTGGSAGELLVEVVLEGLSATPDVDFADGIRTVLWQDGEGGVQELGVPLLDDDEVERTELFRWTLRQAAGGVEPVSFDRDSAVVAIVDDESLGSPCEPDAGTLCLLDDRFRVEAEWRDPRSGDTGLAGAAPELGVAPGTTGAFWFFRPSNLELLVKMLDAREITDTFWVFFGALSDVEYWITVTDTTGVNGPVVFHNEPFELASVADTTTLQEAPPTDPPGGFSKVPPGAILPVAGENSELAVMGGSALTASGTCQPDGEALCLGVGGRFQVRVEWEDPFGNTGPGRAVPTAEGETGLFWFFTEDNLELMVKVIDGTSVNGHFWFFSGALSNVEYTITVTDTITGAERRYENPQGRLRSRADVEAFDP